MRHPSSVCNEEEREVDAVCSSKHDLRWWIWNRLRPMIVLERAKEALREPLPVCSKTYDRTGSCVVRRLLVGLIGFRRSLEPLRSEIRVRAAMKISASLSVVVRWLVPASGKRWIVELCRRTRARLRVDRMTTTFTAMVLTVSRRCPNHLPSDVRWSERQR